MNDYILSKIGTVCQSKFVFMNGDSDFRKNKIVDK